MVAGLMEHGASSDESTINLFMTIIDQHETASVFVNNGVVT